MACYLLHLLDENNKGLYEPSHGSAPDIAGQNKANPLATIMSVSMLFKYTLNRPEIAKEIDAAIEAVLSKGIRTGDIAEKNSKIVGCKEMGDAVIAELQA